MAKSTLQRQKIIADLIEGGNISSQNQLKGLLKKNNLLITCLLYTSPSPRDLSTSRMPSSA